MTAIQTTDPAPDWNALTTEMHCPLCEYNLRGLDQPRCPECGFTFTWAELKLGQEQTHPYLFEHHPKRNVWSFWKTYWRDCRPQAFWRELSPAQPVGTRRLVIYWVAASAIMITAVVTQLGYTVWDNFAYPPVPMVMPFPTSTILMAPMPMPFPTTTSFSRGSRRTYLPTTTFISPGSRVMPSPFAAPPPVAPFWDRLTDASSAALDDCLRHSLFVGAVTVLLWPWLTLLCLMVFAESMRRAKINKRHVLRVIVYGTDFGFIMLIPILLGNNARYNDGFPMLIAVLCGVFTLYRVSFAYQRYLRFHMPFATVLSSQIIVILIFLVAYLRVVQH